jgi:hypothetical protein
VYTIIPAYGSLMLQQFLSICTPASSIMQKIYIFFLNYLSLQVRQHTPKLIGRATVSTLSPSLTSHHTPDPIGVKPALPTIHILLVTTSLDEE